MLIILTTREAEIRRVMVQGQPGQEVNETPFQPIKFCAWWYVLVLPAMMWDAIGGSQSMLA
jgi:hypothetical protein